MAIYFIAYSLANPGRTGKTLWDVLTALGAKRILESVWVLRSNSTAAQIRDHLWPHVGLSGRLAVVESHGIAAWNPLSDVDSV